MAAVGATDQHSILQLLRDGPNDKITWFVTVGEIEDVKIPQAPLSPTRGSYLSFELLQGHGLQELLAKYPQSLLFGEDVAQKGGVYTVTKDLLRRFGPAAPQGMKFAGAGAAGFVLKTAPTAELVTAIRRVVDGGVHFALRPDPGHRDVTFEQMVANYRQQVEALIEGDVDVILAERPDGAAVEEVLGNTNAQSTLKLGQARGVVLLAAVGITIKLRFADIYARISATPITQLGQYTLGQLLLLALAGYGLIILLRSRRGEARRAGWLALGGLAAVASWAVFTGAWDRRADQADSCERRAT